MLYDVAGYAIEPYLRRLNRPINVFVQKDDASLEAIFRRIEKGDALYCVILNDSVNQKTLDKQWDSLHNEGYILFSMDDYNKVHKFRRRRKISSIVHRVYNWGFFQKEVYDDRQVK